MVAKTSQKPDSRTAPGPYAHNMQAGKCSSSSVWLGDGLFRHFVGVVKDLLVLLLLLLLLLLWPNVAACLRSQQKQNTRSNRETDKRPTRTRTPPRLCRSTAAGSRRLARPAPAPEDDDDGAPCQRLVATGAGASASGRRSGAPAGTMTPPTGRRVPRRRQRHWRREGSPGAAAPCAPERYCSE
jgi:hypothetical protein